MRMFKKLVSLIAPALMATGAGAVSTDNNLSAQSQTGATFSSYEDMARFLIDNPDTKTHKLDLSLSKGSVQQMARMNMAEPCVMNQGCGPIL